MNQKPLINQKKTKLVDDNSVEAIKDFSKASQSNNIFDQLMGGYSDAEFEDFERTPEAKPATKKKKDVSLFNYQEYYENQIIKNQIKELTEAVKKEIQLIKKSDKSLLAELSDIQKIALESMPEKAGIYHVRFLEIVLNILKALRAKVGESRTWLQAMVSKKKKRGSLFAALTKKKGTQYSLSQELQSARAIQ